MSINNILHTPLLASVHNQSVSDQRMQDIPKTYTWPKQHVVDVHVPKFLYSPKSTSQHSIMS